MHLDLRHDIVLVVCCAMICAAPATGSRTAEALLELGTVTRWATVEIPLEGPRSDARADPNPFLVEAVVSFRSPSGRMLEVPAFFEGDGEGGWRGSVWKVRFTPDEAGTWRFQSLSDESSLSGYRGRFRVEEPPPDAPMPERCGRLRAVDSPYLKFANGPFWLKGGANEPEDFLAPGVLGETWAEKAETVRELVSHGVNSMYVMLQNVDGDGDNVWPWLERKNSRRFDVTRLSRWEELFRSMQSQGVVLHLVLEDDSGWTGFDRRLYYREMVARFGHHNAIVWNLSEEYDENYRPAEIRRFASLLAELDPYDHPITVHHAGPTSRWEPLLRDATFTVTSFQTDNAPQNDLAVSWRARAMRAGRALVVSFDETGETTAAEAELALKIVWSVYLGGANFELYTGPIERVEDFAEHWQHMRRARELLVALPFWEMSPCNDLAARAAATYCLGRRGSGYVLYVEGRESVALDLSDAVGTFNVTWHDPRSATSRSGGRAEGGGRSELGVPPFEPSSVLTVLREGYPVTEPSGDSPTCFGVPRQTAPAVGHG